MNQPSATPVARPALPKQNILRIQAAKFIESPTAVIGVLILLTAGIVATLAPWIAPQNPYDLMQIDIMDNMLPPGAEMMSGQVAWLGTDAQGRDMLSAILYGLRISLSVGLIAVMIAGAIGATVGVAAAFIGGRFEAIVMRIVDLHLAFPSILIALVLLSAFGRGIDKVILALVIVQWAYYARTVRGSALVETRKDYIAACSVLQLPRWRVLFRHLLPNCIPPLIVVATVQVAGAILLESTLSFLGAGVPVTEPSLGMLISQGYSYMLSGKYWIAVFPGVMLVLVIIAINLVGDRLRIVLNPRLSS
ncbi:ABC transporter permease [Gemmobacter sp.]|uniref:ABC transporter permease n=1 Tax=Gemmobacter sp. TaxID=1898957 RepID=UPI002AFE8E42|nr:ABC transporter permease [Gemmobacter sp.]